MNIHDAIPHRPPFLLVDEVLGIEGNTIRTRRAVRAEEDYFRGHFPGYPLMPGVLICEAIVQSGAILIAHLNGGTQNGIPVLTRLNNAKFKQQVKPGDVLDMEATLKEKLGIAFFMEGVARMNGKTAVSVEFACALAQKDSA